MHRIVSLEKTPSKQWNDIWYGIDFFDQHPIEMKTRRGYLAKDGEEKERYESYIKQLIGYCACEDKTEGELWVWSLLEKTDSFRSAPKMVCYDVLFSGDEIEQERQRLINMRDRFLAALKGDMVVLSELPDCPKWMCMDRKTTVKEMAHCVTCNRDFATDWGLNKHAESKGGKGHEVKKIVYDVTETPKCQWYADCKMGGVIEVEGEQTP